ncbi:MAG: hypothetical protein JST15_11225 [Bacteroidetes bacterium]|nr:hypothetical protein [Bacteroidota bacterium]
MITAFFVFLSFFPIVIGAILVYLGITKKVQSQTTLGNMTAGEAVKTGWSFYFKYIMIISGSGMMLIGGLFLFFNVIVGMIFQA